MSYAFPNVLKQESKYRPSLSSAAVTRVPENAFYSVSTHPDFFLLEPIDFVTVIENFEPLLIAVVVPAMTSSFRIQVVVEKTEDEGSKKGVIKFGWLEGVFVSSPISFRTKTFSIRERVSGSPSPCMR